MMRYDFGYSWIWTYGHLVPLSLSAAFLYLAIRYRWSRGIVAVCGLVAAWSLCGLFFTQAILRVNLPLLLPTAAFLQQGSGEVLDVGAGSGRATLMVLLERPGTRVTALDIFSGDYGIPDNTPERLRANARAGGADDRVEVRSGDMRQMPLGDATFDAVVSAYAIDHLRRDDVPKALSEVARVLRPGGEFLLMVINVDSWVRLVYPLPHHGYFGHSPAAERWRASLEAAGLVVREAGTRPATLYFWAHKAR